MIPTKLKINNFQSYDQAELTFSFSSALIIGERDNNSEVSNGSGKTSIFEAIAWCLFGKCKQKTIDAVVRRGQDVGQVDLWFTHDGKDYHVSRKRNVKFARTEVLLFEIINGREELFPGDTSKDVEAKIREILKSSYEVFINSSYFMQRSISEILSGTPASRQKIISSLLNLEFWDKCAKRAKDLADEYTVQLAGLQVQAESCRASDQDVADLENTCLRLKREQDTCREQQQHNAAVLHTYAQYVGLDISRQRHNLSSSIEEDLMYFEKVQEQHESLKADLRVLEERAVELKEKTNSFSLPPLEEMKNKLAMGSAKLASLKEKNNEFIPEAICECCGKPWKTHPKEWAEYLQRGEEIKALAIKLKLFLEKIALADEQVKSFALLKSTTEELDRKIDDTFQKCENAKSRASVIFKSMEVKRVDLAKLAEIPPDIEVEVKRAQEKKATLENISAILSEKLGSVRYQLEEKKAARERQKNIEAQIREVSKGLQTFKALNQIFSRKGIQALIMDNLVEELVETTNYWLAEFSYESTSVSIETQVQDSKGNWKETFDIYIHSPTGTCDLESLSGGESFRIAFAMRLALSTIQAQRLGSHTSLLLLDEVSTCLDKHGIEVFLSIIKKLEKTMKVMIITHDDSLKEAFNDIILVERKNGCSSIKCQ